MKRLVCTVAVVATAALLPLSAQAQSYSSYPRQTQGYPYVARQPYAIQVAPGTYVIQRPKAERRRAARSEHARAERARARVHNDPAVIEELRRHHSRHAARHKFERKVMRQGTLHGTRHVTRHGKVTVVRGKPVVVVRRRVVDDPPRVIVRPHLIDEYPRGRGLFHHPPPVRIERDLPPYVEQAPGEALPLPPSWHREYRPVERHGARKVRDIEAKASAKANAKASGKARPQVETRKVVVRGLGGDHRTIRAEAEVTILGPDRMNIRLFRQGNAAKVAKAAEGQDREAQAQEIDFNAFGSWDAGRRVKARRFVV